MGLFRDKDEFKQILSELWDRILGDVELTESLGEVKIIVKFTFKDLKTSLSINNKKEPPAYYWDADEIADVEMILESDTAHFFWMEDLNVPLAIGSRRIVAKGSIQKALKLLPALKPAFKYYPEVLKDFNRDDLLNKETGNKKKNFLPGFFRKRSKNIWNGDVLPVTGYSSISGGHREEMPGVSLPSGKEEIIDDIELLKVMYRIRFFEEHLQKAFAEGDLPTEAIHLSIGQEGVAAGVCTRLRNSDYLNTTHRGHGHIIAKGADLKGMMAELYGKRTGLCGGKGGSMHVTDGNIGILGANGIVGAGYLLAMGAGFSLKNKKGDNISVVIAGDGSVNQGMFHEAMNMMSVFHLPVLIVVENNLYGEFTSVERHSAVSEIFHRAEAYNIESFRFNGNNLREVCNEVGKVIDSIRRDGKPRLVELLTYRWRGHMEGDPESYRSAEEKKKYMEEDPITNFENLLLSEKRVTEALIDQAKKEIRGEVESAVEFALDSEEPGMESLLDSIYAGEESAEWSSNMVAGADSKKFLSVSAAINSAIKEEMERDESVFLWGEDVTLGGYFNVTDELVDQFGHERIIDTPISENGIVGGAVGAAMTGMRPIVEILFGDFLSCCMDPILNQAAKLRYMTGGQVAMPLTIRTPVGSGIGMAAQHSQSMEKYFAGIPGLVVVAPSDAYSSKALLKSSIRSNNPVLFFEHKLLYPLTGPVAEEELLLPLGKARILKKGSDVTLVSYLMGVGIALEAAKLLAAQGIDAEIVDLLTLYPLDYETVLNSVTRTGKLVVIEEGNSAYGIAAEVIAGVCTSGHGLLKAPPLRLGAAECPVPYAKNLEQGMLISPEGVADAVVSLSRNYK